MDQITHQSPRQRGYGTTSSLRNDSLKHTRKHERGREESKQEAKLTGSGGPSGQEGRTVRTGLADCPACYRGPSAPTLRTVRPYAVDHPLNHTEPTEATHEPRTVRGEHVDCPPGTHGPSALCCGPSETSSNRNQNCDGSKRKASKNTKNTGRTLAARTVRQVLADRPPGADRAGNAQPRKSTPPNHHRISQTVEAVETRVWGLEKRNTRML
jgi:hypothetical protein